MTKRLPAQLCRQEAPQAVAPRADDDRTMYPAKCATCEADIQVPFKPDASRPTFCKDCLKDYQRQQARVQQAKSAREEKPAEPEGHARSDAKQLYCAEINHAARCDQNAAPKFPPRKRTRNRENKWIWPACEA